MRELKEFPSVGFCNYNKKLETFLLKKFGFRNKAERKEKATKLGWNRNGFWYVITESRKPEYKIEELERFFPSEAQDLLNLKKENMYWFIKITEENYEELNAWSKKINGIREIDGLRRILPPFGFLLSEYNGYKGYTFLNKYDIPYTPYIEITIEEFREETGTYIQQEKKERNITWEKAQEVINNVCPFWQSRLLKIYSIDIVLKKEIIVSEELYQEGRKAATPSVDLILDKIFGKDSPKCPYKKGELIFVHSDNEWHLRYSNGELDANGNACYYMNQRQSGAMTYSKKHYPAPGVKLP